MMVGFQSKSEEGFQASGGYSGIQHGPGGKNIIFSLWRSKDFTPEVVEYNTNWPGAKVLPFGGAGTGMKFSAPFLWTADSDVTMQVQADLTSSTDTHQTWHVSAFLIYENESHFLCTYKWIGTVPLVSGRRVCN